MPKALSEEQLRRYESDGYIFPIDALPEADLARYTEEFDKYLVSARGRMRRSYNNKLHLVAPWAAELVRHPRILDPVEDLLGPDILVWTTNLLAKRPGHPEYVSWHSDANYWGLEPHEVCTAWVALSPSTKESGCVRVLPGSHRRNDSEHRDTFDEANMLTRGQELVCDIKKEEAVDLELAAGQISLHHVRLYHGSEPNRSDARRVGVAIRYMSANVKKLGRPESASLVRGVDRNGYFRLEPQPDGAFTKAARIAHNRAVRRQVANNNDPNGSEDLRTRLRLLTDRAFITTALDIAWARWRIDQLLGR